MTDAPPPQEGALAPEDPGRRAFLKAATCAVGACAAAAALGPAVFAIVSPARGGIVKIGEGAIDLGPLEAFEEGIPRKVVVRGAPTDAFVKFGERSLGSVVVVRAKDKVTVFSATCPHAGCDVSPQEKELFCPCHNSRFALDGAVLGGPSPRGLDALDARVDGGHVRVKYERFQVGTAERRPV